MKIGMALLGSMIFHVMILSIAIPQESSSTPDGNTNVIQVYLEQNNKGPGGNTEGDQEGNEIGREMNEFIKEVAPEIYAQEQKEREQCTNGHEMVAI